MSDTIVAIASGVAPAAIGVIRMSGDDALQIVEKCLKKKGLTPRMMHHRGLCDGRGVVVDDVMVCYFKAPHSYTGEDSVEVYAHGGAVNLGRVLSVLCAAGARMAEPGEFSKRAFLNGKIDLTRAEAIMDVIHAQNELQCREAQKQLSGTVSDSVNALRKGVLDLLCKVEVEIDFEEDLDEDDTSGVSPFAIVEGDGAYLSQVIEEMIHAHERYRSEGLRVVMVGLPNAGKSSLFNRLVGHERAIVTPIAGTTTDTIEAQVVIDGEQFSFIDTAGVTETDNPIEALGVERTQQQIKTADIIVVCIDGVSPSYDALQNVRSCYEAREGESPDILLIRTKSDIEERPQVPLDSELQSFIESIQAPMIDVSSKTRDGLLALKSELCACSKRRHASGGDMALITSQRHIECLRKANEALREAVLAMQNGLPGEIIASELHNAASALEQITGAITYEDVVNEIFSHFCIGK